MLLDGAFTALLLLVTTASAAVVPPPTNVTVTCRNLQTTVQWEYSQQEPQTRFRVNIKGSAGGYEDETTDHQYDLSHFIWESEERYMGFLYVTVTAIQGDNPSNPVESESFSYNDLKTTDKKCELDFPPVVLTVEDSESIVSFQNPLHYYEKLRRAIKQGAPTFGFSVSVNGSTFDRYCGMEQSICKEVIYFPEGVEKCVTLKGVLFDGNGIGQVPFGEDKICPSESSDVHVMTLVILLAFFVLIVIVITLIVCKVKAWTMRTPGLPKSLEESQLPRHGAAVHNPAPERDESVVQLIVHQTKKSPSVSSEEGIVSLLADSSSGGMYVEGRLSDSSCEDLGAAGLDSEGHGTDEDSAEDSVKTECVSLVSEEEGRSPYDCPHHIDMGDGDKVWGYD